MHKVQKQQTSPYDGQNLTELRVTRAVAGEWGSQLTSRMVSSVFTGTAHIGSD